MRKYLSLGRLLPLLCGGFCFILVLFCAREACAQQMPITRALLIACERFVTQESLAPSAAVSAMNIARTLAKNGGTLQSIHTEINTIGTVAQLEAAIQNTFADATEDDVSLFYIATHGNFHLNYPNAQPTLSLSDGQTETTFAGTTLRELLSSIPGTKIVLIDACNSGALIGKGINLSQNHLSSAGPIDTSLKMLTSASGNELSWHYSEHMDEEGARKAGGSYFGAALSRGLGLYGTYPADLNQDGQITLDELYRYLLQNHAVSTVQVYPQRDDFVLLTYDKEAVQSTDANPITDITFANEAIRADQPQLTFSFTVRRAVRVEYHITYQRNGAWDWEHTRRYQDTFDDGQAEAGALSPGRKQRSIQMQAVEPDSAGYALFQMMALEEDGPTILCSRLLSVLPTQGDPRLSIQLPYTSFVYWSGQELPIYVQHAFPLRLSVNLYDLSGNLVCRVVENQLTRPLQLDPEGSVYYWDGKDQYGNVVSDGVYTLVASTRVGDVLHETQPLLFQFIVPSQ